MKIVVCESCGRLIHRAERCYHCGSGEMYPSEYQVELHSAAAENYARMEELLSHGEYQQVLELSEQVLEWMGFSSEVYWMRLLARSGCSTDRELLAMGADLEEDPDYYNAIRHAEAEEHQVYLDLRDQMDSVREALAGLLRRHFREEKLALGLKDCQQELDRQLEAGKPRVLELWEQLVQMEDQIRTLDARSQAALRPHREVLALAQSQANAIRKNVSELKECDEQQFRNHILELSAALRMSEGARLALEEMMEHHPWAAEYQRLKEERDDIQWKLIQEVRKLSNQAEKLEELLSKLEALEAQEAEALRTIEKGTFRQARGILGEETFAQALTGAGVMG